MTWIGAEAELCQRGDDRCDPVRALLALDRFDQTRRQLRRTRSTLASQQRTGAERAMLEAAVANGETLSSAQLARLRELRSESGRGETATPRDARTIERIVAAIPPRTTVLVFFHGRGDLVTWVLQNQQRRLLRQPVSERVTAAAALDLQRAVVDRREDWPGASAKLWKLLIEPAGEISRGDTLVVLAWGALSRTPFEILGRDERNLLLEAHPIVYTDTLGSLHAEAAPRRNTRSALVAGVNDATVTRAEEEAAAIAAVLDTTPLLGNAATAQAIRARLPNATTIHFAMHTTLVPRNPFNSYLQLGGGERLRAWELFREAPAAELITLSGCDTLADSRRIRGMDASIGQSTSFASFAFSGGARFVVASLWTANDRIASRLMQRFYSSLRDGEARSLQAAKLAIREEGVRHPFYYANFFLSVRSVAAAVDSR